LPACDAGADRRCMRVGSTQIIDKRASTGQI
jgi:hypothetical protein